MLSFKELPKNARLFTALSVFAILFLVSCEKDDYTPTAFEHDNYLDLTFNDNWIGREFQFRITDGEVFVDLNGNQLEDKNERLEPNDKRDVSFIIPGKHVRIYGDFVYFYYNGGGIHTLDITNHRTLEYILGAGLSDLKARNNTALHYINITSTRFSTYDFSQLPNLESVVLYKGQLTAVDFSKNPKLDYLDLSGNKLTALNLSQNKEISRVNLYRNAINQSGMQTFVNSLPPANPDKITYAVVYSTNHPDGADGNKITKAQVAQMKAKGWGVRQHTFHDNGSTESDFAGL